MMPQQIIKHTEEKMVKAITAYKKELSILRAGRANAAVLDRVQVNYYGAPTPINQLANISTPEARLLVLQPYDKSSLEDIEKAILKADLGLNPSNDGTIIRIAFPALTEERRKGLVKEVRKLAEDAKVAIRNVRRDGNDELKKLEKNGDITTDDLHGYSEDIQKETDKSIVEIDSITKEKEQELLSI